MSNGKDKHNEIVNDTTASKQSKMSSAISAFDNSGIYAGEPQTEVPNEPEYERHKHRSHKSVRRNQVIKKGLIGFVTVLLVVTLAIMLMVAIGEYAMKNSGNFKVRLGKDAVSYDEGRTVYYNGNKYVYNENTVSLCFLGTDLGAEAERAGRNGQADFVALITINTLTGKTRAITIPRDTMIETGEYIGEQFAGMNKYMQLCMTYGFGDNGYLSCKYCTNAVERIFYNVPIKYYFSLNYRDVPALNDTAGGVTLTPIETIPGTNIVKGQQITLSGNNAAKYVQYRNTAVLGSDQGRLARQKHYAASLVSQLFKQKGAVSTVVSIYNDALQYITTNLGANEVMYLTSVALRKDLSNPDIITLGGEVKKGDAYDEFWVDMNQVWDVVLDTYYTKVSSSDYENMSYNEISLDEEGE